MENIFELTPWSYLQTNWKRGLKISLVCLACHLSLLNLLVFLLFLKIVTEKLDCHLVYDRLTLLDLRLNVSDSYGDGHNTLPPFLTGIPAQLSHIPVVLPRWKMPSSPWKMRWYSGENDGLSGTILCGLQGWAGKSPSPFPLTPFTGTCWQLFATCHLNGWAVWTTLSLLS